MYELYDILKIYILLYVYVTETVFLLHGWSLQSSHWKVKISTLWELVLEDFTFIVTLRDNYFVYLFSSKNSEINSIIKIIRWYLSWGFKGTSI